MSSLLRRFRRPVRVAFAGGRAFSTGLAAGHAPWTVVAELALTIYTILGIVYAIVTDEWGALPFLVLFASGYALVAYYSIRHGLGRLSFARKPRAELAEPAEPISAEPLGAPALSIMSER